MAEGTEAGEAMSKRTAVYDLYLRGDQTLPSGSANRETDMPNRRELSPLAWAMLDQLRQQGRVWDGDCVSKAGRDELIACELAMRDETGHTRLVGYGTRTASAMQADADWHGERPKH